jgi:glycerophosphoryl diester phosphodiesterase
MVAGGREFTLAAHRGAKQLAPENTMRAFEVAVDLGVDELEFDIRLSRDGIVVVHHDETLERCTDGSGAVRDHDWQALSLLRVGGTERIPTLRDIFDAPWKVSLQVELKEVDVVPAFLDLVDQHPSIVSRLFVTSFLPDALAAVIDAKRGLRTGLICDEGEAHKFELGTSLGVDQFLANWSLVAAVPTGITADLSVWPCETPEALTRAVTDGFVGTTTGEPAMAVSVLRGMA